MNQSRGAFTAQISRKRKEREDFFLPSHSHYHAKQSPSQSHPKTTSLMPKPVEPPVRSNRILAGYMAHEFLTKGTLLGQIFDPVRVQAVPVPSSLADQTKKNIAPPSLPESEKSAVYTEVACLLKKDGAHIPGIVNPSQLARWINQK